MTSRPPRATALAAGFLALWLGACAAPAPKVPPGPSPEEMARKLRIERATGNLNEGLKLYEAGTYEDAMKNFLIALDSGVLTVPQQLNARKHMAFIQCVNNRELVCKEEFEKAFVLDPKFELTPAEAGHPTWGPIFRLVKTEIELRKSGKSLPSLAAPKVPTAGEKLLAEGMKEYEEAEFYKASKLLQDALKELLQPADQQKAMKYSAFSYCLTNRMTLCRAEFEKLLQANPAFDLDAAEAGHPSWGPAFRAIKAKHKPAPAPAPAPVKK